MNKDKEKIIFPLMVVLGFLIGIILGYVMVGIDVENNCREVISNYQTYIANSCSGGVTADGLANLNLTGVFNIGV